MYTIRLAEESDAIGVLAVYRPYVEETAITFEYEVPTQVEFLCRLQRIQSNYPFLVCEEKGQIIGYAYAHRQMTRAAYQWNAELSVYVDRKHTGRGVGKALYTTLIEILKLQHVQTVCALITLPNPVSETLHHKMGFKRIGLHPQAGYKLGKWYDVAWYEKVIGNRESPPPDVLPVGEIALEKLQKVLQASTQ
jgi:L-amino acid N-acyltransferase YncA